MTEMTRTTTDDWDDYWDMKLQKNYGYALGYHQISIISSIFTPLG